MIDILPMYISTCSAALLKRFLSTKPNTFEQIQQYLDNARLHPTVVTGWTTSFSTHSSPNLIVQGERGVTDKYISSISSSLVKLSHQNPLEMCVFPDEGNADHVSGVFVCRHHEGARTRWPVWRANCLRIQQGSSQWHGDCLLGLSAIGLTPSLSHYMCLVTWCPSTLINHQASLRQNSIRRIWSIYDDHSLIDAEVDKYPHPLESRLPYLYNTLTGKIAFRTKITNEHDALMKMPIVKSFPHASHVPRTLRMMVCLVVMRRTSLWSPMALMLATLARPWYIYLMTIRHVWV